MPNMSYYRFQNTLQDLRDCYDNMDRDDLSREEFQARQSLIMTCISIAEHYSDLMYKDFKDQDEEEEEQY